MNLQNLIHEQQALIIDVRTPAEFMGGNVLGSINIPLHEMPNKLDFFNQQNHPIVLCCASGNRSGQAAQFLTQSGITNVHNGGSWYDINFVNNNKNGNTK